MAFMFEKLDVYQKAVDLADEITATTEAFPRGYRYLVDQLNRAALSIATNLSTFSSLILRVSCGPCLSPSRSWPSIRKPSRSPTHVSR